VAAEYEVNIKINTQQIERELKKVDKAVNNIGKGKGGKKQPILALPSTEMLNATARKIQSLDKINRKIALRQREINKQTRDQALNINTLAKTQEKRARLLNKINEMEVKGLNVSKLRKQLAKATTEQSNRRFGSAEKEFRILEKSIRLEQSKLRILKEQRKGFASSPVGGTRTMMGSPAQIAAAGRQIASPIGGGLNFPGSPAFLAGATASRTPFGPSFPTGGAALPIRGSISIPGSPVAVQAAKATNLRAVKVETSWAKALGELQETAGMLKMKDTRIKQSWSTALAELNETASLLRVRSQQASAGLTGQSSPIGGATNIPGSPAFLRRQQRNKILGQVGLGAGFPLLFGGGAGSVIGGALGGLTGSFGAQIAFSAIGQQIDQFVAGVAAVGTALTSASGTVEMFREKNLFSSDAVKKHAFELEKQGRMQELATLLTKDLASQIGTNAVKSFQNLGGEVKEFLDSINHLFVAVGGFVAGPLAKLLDAINATLGGVSTNVEFQSLRDSLTGDAKAEFEAIIARERGVRELSNRERQRALMMEESVEPREGRLTTAVKERVLQDPAIAALRQTLNVTGQTTLDDTLGFKDRAAEEQKRIDQRIAALQIEAAKIAEISAFKDRIAAAEAVGDTMLVIRLQGQQRLKEIESSRLEKLIKATTQREQDAINLVAQAEKTAAIAQTEREISAEYLKRQNLFDDTVADLEHQLAISQATSEAERERLRIEKKLQELKKKGLEDSQVAQIGQLMGQISAENSPLNKFIKQSVESLNNLEQHAVQVAQGIGSAIGNSLVSGMQNLITGAQSVKEVFADMLKSIADVLAKQAAQMIATYIAIGIARAFAGMGGEGADPNSAAVGDVLQQGGFTTGNMADQASAGTFTFAEGGYVSGPTRALVGEGGQGEYIIPENRMRESMARYSRGARGSAVIPEAGGTGTSGEGGGTAVAAPIDVRYTVERINSVDYVTADQFQRGMQQAASQGAKQGEQQTLKRLQMSGSTRKRLGM